ncbi:MAG: peptidylprolyl isomerase [Planctomycetes bacterium]|nr:peptidylprolyl isomerase [Planctomycetota bacterium]
MIFRAHFIALTLALSGLPLHASQENAAPRSFDESVTVLRIGDREVSWNEYGAWLVRVAGTRHVDDTAREHVVLRELAAAGLEVTAEEARAQVEAQAERRIATAFEGDRAKWIDELERTGSDEASFFAEHTAEVLGELRVQTLVMSRRRTDEAGLRAAWETLYGPGGRQPELRGLRIEIEEVIYPEGADATGKEMLDRAKRKQVERRSSELLRRARAGEDFGELVLENSDDAASRELDGYLPEPYVITDWPAEMAAALRTAKEGSFVGPFFVGNACWCFQVVSIVETPFESVKERIVDHLRNDPPSAAETRVLFTQLLAGQVPRSLPELWTDPTMALERMDRPVAALGDTALSRREMATWLTARRGYAEAPLFAQMQLVEARAASAGVELSELAVQQRIEADIAARIELEHKGDKRSWIADLTAQGKTEEDFRLGQEPRTRHGLLVEQMLLAERVVTDEDVRALWEDRYGPNGESPRIRVILRRPTPLPRGVKPTEEQMRQYLTSQELEITTLLNELIGRLEAGEDFATLAKRYSQDDVTKDNGGLQPHRFRLDTWPENVRMALQALEVGQVSNVVEVGKDYYIFENSGVTTVPLEEVAEGLRKELVERRPSSIEVARFIANLARDVEVTIDPALVEPYFSATAAQR